MALIVSERGTVRAKELSPERTNEGAVVQDLRRVAPSRMPACCCRTYWRSGLHSSSLLHVRDRALQNLIPPRPDAGRKSGRLNSLFLCSYCCRSSARGAARFDAARTSILLLQ